MSINKLISQLIAIKEFAKDIHYSVRGEDMYCKHLLVDRIQGNINDYIDSFKEDAILAKEQKPLSSKVYLSVSIKEILDIKEDDKDNFKAIKALIKETLKTIDSLKTLTMGDENLVGEIAQNLQNSLGLINLLLRQYDKKS